MVHGWNFISDFRNTLYSVVYLIVTRRRFYDWPWLTVLSYTTHERLEQPQLGPFVVNKDLQLYFHDTRDNRTRDNNGS